jgi:hypothetical protein
MSSVIDKKRMSTRQLIRSSRVDAHGPSSRQITPEWDERDYTFPLWLIGLHGSIYNIVVGMTVRQSIRCQGRNSCFNQGLMDLTSHDFVRAVCVVSACFADLKRNPLFDYDAWGNSH